MNQFSPESLEKSRNIFRDSTCPTLQSVRDRVAKELLSTRRRDTLSAFDAVPKLLGQALVNVAASPPALRNLFASRNAAQLGVSEKRYANIRSLIIRAARNYGHATPILSKRLPISEEWTALLSLIPEPDYRSALRRLACFASALGVEPEALTNETLLGFFEALEADEILKSPRKILHNTVGYWNMSRRRIAGWPPIVLSSPFPSKKYILALKSFPLTFQEDVCRWQAGLADVDPFEGDLAKRPQRKVTAEHNLKNLLRFASALIHTGKVHPADLNSLAALCDPEIVKNGLRIFIKRARDRATGYVRQYAQLLYSIAAKYCRPPQQELDKLKVMVQRLEAGKVRGMRPGVAKKLEPFDDPTVYQNLLRYPFEERNRGLRQNNPQKTAKHIDRALAAALCIYLALRMKNLHTMRIDTNLRKAGSKWFVSFIAEEMKGNRPLELELPDEVAKLLELYVHKYRRVLPGSQGPYLFAGKQGGPRHHSALRKEFKDGILRHTGLRVNPHLTRHIIGKRIAEQDPALIPALSQFLAHASVQTTINYYLENNGRTASRKLNQILEDTLQKTLLRSGRRK
jgi:integrase